MRPKIDHIEVIGGNCPEWTSITPQVVIRRDSTSHGDKGWYYMRWYSHPTVSSMVRAFLALMKLTERAKQ